MSLAIDVDDVSKHFRIFSERNQSLKASILRRRRSRFEEFSALSNVSLQIPKGTTVGIVGHNGSGKSTLLKFMARILQPDSGAIRIDGTMSALLELGAGFHPELSGRENVFLNGSILGMSKKLVESQFDSILEFSGLERFIDNPVKTYSSGMYVRLGFAVATSVQPDVLLVDEVLAVGDEEFQRRCGTRFRDLQSRGSTVVLVSHGMQTMRELCDQLVWLDEGRVRMVGTPQEVIDEYHGKVVDDERDREEQIAEEVHPHDRKTLEVRIVKAEVIGEVAPSPVDSAAVTQLHTGDTLRVRITVTSESPVRDVRVTCGVYSNTGVTISIATTAEGKADIAVLDGETVLEFVVPNVQFRAGRHDIAVGVMGALDDRVIDVRQGLASFAMITEPAIDTWGVVDLGGSWTVVHPTDRA